MKKLFSLLTLALLTLSVGATTVTFTAGTDMGTNGASGNPDSMTKDGITISGTDLATTTAEYRLYANSTTTFSSTAGNITSIEFTCTATGENKYGPGCLSTQTGEYIYDGTDGLWSGSATSIAFAASKQVRCTQIVVTVDDSGTTPVTDKVATPTFTPYNADGYHFTGSLAVTVSCSTENAAIALYKVVDGEIDYSTYQYIFQSGEVYVTENTTYVALASKGGMEDSEYAYATYVLDNDNPDPQVTDYIKFNHADDATTARGEYTVTRNGASFTVSDGLVGAESYRIYKGATITFTSTVGNIVKIEFDGYNSSNKVSGFGENDGMTYEGNNGTWTGNAATVTLTVNDNQVRASEIRVYVDGEVPVTVMDPTFNPSNGYTFTTDTLDVTINCATEGATIVYVVNNGDEVVAPAPVTVTLNETSTIMAYAKLGEVESNIVEATYTKEDAPVYEPWEGTEAYLSNRDKGDFSGNSACKYTISKEERPGISFTVSNGMAADNGYRIYKSQTITFNSLVGNITMIQFIGVEGNPVSNFGEVEGMTYDGNNGIWIGDTATVTFTASVAQVRATEIRVTVGERPVLLNAPVIAPENNTVFAGSQQVTINCATEGAQVYYMIDEGEATLYEGPFTIDASCTVKAYSVLGEQTSATVSATYHLGTEINTIAEGNTENGYYIYNGEAVVTYQDKSNGNTWIRDNSGSGMIYGYYVPDMEQGTVISDGWTANFITYKNVPEFRYPMGVQASGDVVAVEPFVRESVTDANVNEYVVMKGISLLADTDNTKKFYNAADSLVIFNQFNLADSVLNIEEGKLYDVEGIVTIFNETTLELYITKVTEAVAEQWQMGDVNHDKSLDVADVTALIAHILGNESGDFFVEQANVDGDAEGSIDVGDVTALIAMILGN